jgi:hypothetical protein
MNSYAIIGARKSCTRFQRTLTLRRRRLREALGVPLPSPDRAEVEQAVAPARASLGEERWAIAFAAGQALSLEQAIAEALGEGGEVAG